VGAAGGGMTVFAGGDPMRPYGALRWRRRHVAETGAAGEQGFPKAGFFQKRKKKMEIPELRPGERGEAARRRGKAGSSCRRK
jgi:hypothetical protein